MDEENRTCPYCKQQIKIKTGLSNFKNLFRKPTLEDCITLFIIIMVIFMGYAYKSDIKSLNDYYENGTYCEQKLIISGSPSQPRDFGGLELNYNQEENEQEAR